MRGFLLVLAVSAAFAQAPCPVLPTNNVWNTAIDQLPVSPNSSTWVNTIGATKTVHADFGSGLYNGGPIGIPYVIVPGSQTMYPATFTYADESDPGPYAIPLNAPIEGGSTSTGDRHAIAIDTGNCTLYELYAAYPQTNSWQAGSGAIFNLLSNTLRPAGWTSADAAGLPVFPGLVRYDEIVAGAILHAIRFTVPQTQKAYLWPARHYASTLTGSQYPPMGARFRLRSSFDISGFSATNRIVLNAMKKYGMLLADNGSAWYISGAPDSRWDNNDLHALGTIPGSAFEAVDESSLMVDPNSGEAKQPTGVTVTVSPSTATVVTGASQQFTASVTNSTTQLVNWSVNATPGGNSTVGLIATSGLYTAPAVVPSGSVTVTAASADAPSATGSASVKVVAPAPLLSSVAPTSGSQGTSVAVTLTGSNFNSGATLAVSGGGISVSNVTVVSAARITATFTLSTNASTGNRNVRVTTTGGTTGAVTFAVLRKRR